MDTFFHYYCYYRVKLSEDQQHGKIHGRLVWRGRAKPADQKITTALKKEWTLISTPNYQSFQGTPADIAKLIPIAEPVSTTVTASSVVISP